MKRGITFWPGLLAWLAITQFALAQSPEFRLPERVKAGSSFSAPTAGSGPAILYIAGPGGAFRRHVRLGETISFAAGEITRAGHYLAVLVVGSFAETKPFDVVAAQPAALSFLAKPSRVPVNQNDGISGVAYVFDVFHNIVLEPQQVSFVLSATSASPQSRTVSTGNGVAWIRMNSAAKAGPAQFEASLGNIRERRVVQQVAGEPCTVRLRAHESGPKIRLETEPVHDCSGNAVPDGTIVTFTETYGDNQATVDVPLKRGIAQTEMPARRGALISAAIGVVMGNEIRWNGGQ